MVRIYFFLVLLFLINVVFSQVVNIEKKRTESGKGGVQGNIDFSFSMIENNNSILQGKNNLKLQYYKGKNLFMFFNDITLSKVNENKFQNDGYQHLRYNYNFTKGPVIAEVFVQHQYNTIRKMERRLVGGLGPRFRVIEKDTFRLYFGPLSMYEYEILTNGLVREKFRLSCYVSLGYTLKKWLTFSNITYYQPNYADFNDYKLASEASLLIKITDKLALKTFLEIAYESMPPEGVKRLYYNFNNGLSYFF